MVKMKKKLKRKKYPESNNYQIKTRNRDKKPCTMSREIKNLKEGQWFSNISINTKNIDTNNSNSNNTKQGRTTRFSKKFKKFKNKKELKIKIKLEKKYNIKNSNLNELPSNNTNCNTLSSNSQNSGKKSKKNKNHKVESAKKIQNEIYKYNYKNKEYFELKEVLRFLYDELNIDLDSPNNK